MDLDREITLVSIVTVAMTIAGIVLVLGGGPGLWSMVGILMVIGAAMLFLIEVKDLLERADRENARVTRQR